MKPLFINKLAPSYKDYVLSQEPDSLNTATNTARAMWKRKNPAGYFSTKIQSLTVSPITSEIENSLQQLPEYIREESIKAIKTDATTPTAITIRPITGVTQITMLPRTTNHKEERKTSHQQHTKLSPVGSVTKKVILKSNVDQDYVKTNHSH
jgi:hypothetical protein